jgi:predicted adenine nucleotide alpha hydrolase (AANH) superfamily ATPase
LGFFYNPNIHPLMEYRRRLEGAKETAQATDTELIVDAAYDPQDWFAAVGGAEGSRCELCIAMRLQRAAGEAVAQGCDAFSTSLTISPWQDHEAIKRGGQAAAQEHGVEFLYEDLRAEYPVSRTLSRERGIYRQKYCGCLVSEWERFSERPCA